MESNLVLISLSYCKYVQHTRGLFSKTYQDVRNLSNQIQSLNGTVQLFIEPYSLLTSSWPKVWVIHYKNTNEVFTKLCSTNEKKLTDLISF
jgi:hypothetical protein